MGFTFLHAADLHLGSPLTGLSLKDESVARRFSAASRDAFSELVSRAIAEKVAFAVIAGDIYDGDWRDTSIGLFFNREVARLARADIPVFLIRGNHDAESEITKAVPLPDSVILFPSTKAATRRLEALRVAIHGRSFQDRTATENYALAYPDPVPGWFNIGLLHTSCEGHPAHAVYAPCTVENLASRGYDYWALGHVHEHKVLSTAPYIVYPGNLQGRSVRECGPKGAVLVDVTDGHVARLRPLVVDQARWLHETVDLDGTADEREAFERIADALRGPLAATGGRTSAMRVTLTGATPVHRRLKADLAQIRADVQALAHHLHEDVWIETLRIATREPGRADAAADSGSLDPDALLGGLENDPAIREAAQALLAQVLARIPGGTAGDGTLAAELDAILADARALAVGRALAGQER